MISLPGLLSTDILIRTKASETEDDQHCPLTLEPLHEKNDAVFFTECIKNINLNPHTKMDKDWQEMKAYDFDKFPNLGAIKIKGCGHIFGGAALMYEIMTKRFKCPICRGGSSHEVDLKYPETPENMHKKTWEVLRGLAAKVRQNDTLQRIMDENLSPENVISLVSIVEIYQTLPWQMTFSIYRSENPTTNERPYMIIPISMRVDDDIVIHEDGHVEMGETTIRSGE